MSLRLRAHQRNQSNRLSGPFGLRLGPLEHSLRANRMRFTQRYDSSETYDEPYIRIKSIPQASKDAEEADDTAFYHITRYHRFGDNYDLGFVIAEASKGTRQMVLFPGFGCSRASVHWVCTGKAAKDTSCFVHPPEEFDGGDRFRLMKFLHDVTGQEWLQDILQPPQSDTPAYVLTKQVRCAVFMYQCFQDHQALEQAREKHQSYMSRAAVHIHALRVPAVQVPALCVPAVKVEPTDEDDNGQEVSEFDSSYEHKFLASAVVEEDPSDLDTTVNSSFDDQ